MKPPEEMEYQPVGEYREMLELAEEIGETYFEGHVVLYDKFQTESGIYLQNAKDIVLDEAKPMPENTEIGQKITEIIDPKSNVTIRITLTQSNALIEGDGVVGRIVVEEGQSEDPAGIWQFLLQNGEVKRGGLFAKEQVDLLKWQTVDLIKVLTRLRGA